jgi:hypothetical protein
MATFVLAVLCGAASVCGMYIASRARKSDDEMAMRRGAEGFSQEL